MNRTRLTGKRSLWLAPLVLAVACDGPDSEVREVSTRISGALNQAVESPTPADNTSSQGPVVRGTQEDEEAGSPASPRSVHFDAIVLDTHIDTTLSMVDGSRNLSERNQEGHLDLPRMFEGGLDGAFFSVWVDPRRYVGDLAFQRALSLFNAVHAAGRENSNAAIADDYGDVLSIVSRGRLALLLGVEGGHALGSEEREVVMERLHTFRALGARYLTITWSTDNPLGHASTGDHPERGLTDLGAAVVREMERIGMIVDVSHVSDQTFSDIMALATRPVMASHSSARSLSDHPRNMSDDMIRQVGAGGGVVCVNFYAQYVDAEYGAARRRIREANPEAFAAVERAELGYTERGPAFRAVAQGLEPGLLAPDVSTVADHIMHIVTIAGPQAACLGSDFDGVPELPIGLESVASLPVLSVALKERGLSDEVLRLVLGGNVLRVLGTSE